MTTPCPTVVALNYPLWATKDLGYCYDGTYWYGISTAGNVVRYNFPTFISPAATIYIGTGAGGATYPAIDFSGSLYCLDTHGSNNYDVKKINLTTLATSTLATINGGASGAFDLCGLVYHPTTGLLYAKEIAVGAFPNYSDKVISIHPTTGAVTTLATVSETVTNLIDFEPMVTTPQYVWGTAYYTNSSGSGEHLFTLQVNNGAFVEQADGDPQAFKIPPGIGTKTNTLLLDRNPGSVLHAYEMTTAFSPTLWTCLDSLDGGFAGNSVFSTANKDWTRVAWAGPPAGCSGYTVYEIAATYVPQVWINRIMVG